MKTSRERREKYCSIIGAHLAMAPLSFLWIYGNLSAYMDSYFHFSCSPKCTDADAHWIISLYNGLTCPGIFLERPLERRLGLKWTGIVAMVTCALALFGSAWVLQQSVAWTAVLYGVLLGHSVGVTLSVSFQIVTNWAPDKAAILVATSTGAATGLSIIENQLITAYVNPRNLKPTSYIGPKMFFSQAEILNRVPMAVIIYAAITLFLQVVGYSLITNPPPASSDQQPSGNSNKKKMEIIEDNRDGHAFPTSLVTLENATNANNQKQYGSKNGSNDILDNQGSSQPEPNGIGRSDHAIFNIAEKEAVTDIQARDVPKSWKPSEAIKTPVFYSLFMFGISIAYGLTLKANYYKQFALLYIHNDNYLTLVGTLIPVMSTSSRILYGTCLDKGLFNIKDALVIALAINSVMSAFWFIAPQIDAIFYMILVLLLALTQGTTFVVLPTAAFRIFGPDHFSNNYGLLYTGILVAGILSAIVVPPLLHSLGWFWLFTSVSILSLVTIVMVAATNFNIEATFTYKVRNKC
ncbi:oxalate:formate antiporter-like isoform x1 [Plakobranchus ocellatus]|uniref:Oxalate:formate antiporter-like isoform x1 n=1 Tax=Plakobranchus ocellatus TaxID=259542 RepID=A0AAV4CHK5_9GAST|nr:oxalate:formate antiporter-like isoform x1 [Plakobranchus ocellatus]